jgi:hypothetical protein
MGLGPFGSGLEKISDRVGKLLIWLELEERRSSESAQNPDSQGFTRKIFKRWDLAEGKSAGGRVERYFWRLGLLVSILLIVYAGRQGQMSHGGCGKVPRRKEWPLLGEKVAIW